MAMVGENGPPLEGWALPDREPKPAVQPPRCCGNFCDSLVCTVCGNYVALGMGEN